jgi:hypothetical protein
VNFIIEKITFLTHCIFKSMSILTFCSFDAEFRLFLTKLTVATFILHSFYFGSYTNPTKQS